MSTLMKKNYLFCFLLFLVACSKNAPATPVDDDDVVVTESDKLRANLTLYINSTTVAKEEKDKPNYTPEEIDSLLNYIGNNIFDGVKAEPSKYTENSYDFLGNLKKGTKLKIISLASNIRGGRSSYNIAAGKYETIMFDFYVDGKLISRNRKNNDKNIITDNATKIYNINLNSLLKCIEFDKENIFV